MMDMTNDTEMGIFKFSMCSNQMYVSNVRYIAETHQTTCMVDTLVNRLIQYYLTATGGMLYD